VHSETGEVEAGKVPLVLDAVDSHVGGVRTTKNANDSALPRQKVLTQLELDVFCMRAAEVSLQVDAVCNLRHHEFGKKPPSVPEKSGTNPQISDCLSSPR